jgi:ferric-dicitrate binding protein FerR (iron transport regulator)
MFTTQKTNWGLLAKYLAGETGDQENAAIDKWLNKSPENRALFGKLRSDWKIMDTMNKQFNVDNAWSKLHGRITALDSSAGMESGRIVSMQRRRSWFVPVRMAASLLFIAVLGVFLVYMIGGMQKVNISTASNERLKSVSLPDGSTVIMNANSSLSYSKRFSRKTRDVRLSGEAFFEVAHDKTRPFYVHTDGADIRVVGTSFNVNTSHNDHRVEVYVLTGIVEMSRTKTKDRHVLLHPRDLGTCSRKELTSKLTNNENAIAWKTGIMDFQETRLSEAIEVLNKMYKVDIICLDPGLANIKTNGEYIFTEEPLDTILAVFHKQNNMKVEKSDNKIYLSK